MKIGIFDPYLDTLGGGEKFILTAAQCLSGKNKVYVFWPPHRQEQIKRLAKQQLNLNLNSVTFTRNIFTKDTPFLQRILSTRDYDVIFYISDGSIPLLFAKKNFLLFQFPVNWVNGQDFLTKIKLKRITKVLCYSSFVKQYIDKTFSVNSLVLAPPVNISMPDNKKKVNVILTVGRFTQGVNRKKQEILIEIFKKICDAGLTGWRFIVVGAVLPQDKKFISNIKDQAKGYPIEIQSNISFEKLMDCYARSRIYWHAAGFGEDLEQHPERAEHFGITTVEAMIAGLVPIVFNAGGQREIVQDGKNGLLWNTLQELQDKTLWVIRDNTAWQRLSESAKRTSISYSKERFCKEMNEIIA